MTLSIIAALPLLGALLLATLKQGQIESIKRIALGSSLITLAATVLLALNFEIDHLRIHSNQQSERLAPIW